MDLLLAIIIGVVGAAIGLISGTILMTMLIQGKLASLGIIFKNGTVERILACGGWFHYQDGIGFMPDECRFINNTTPTHVVVNNMSREEFEILVNKALKAEIGGGLSREQLEEIAKRQRQTTTTVCACCVDCPSDEPCEP